MFDDESDDKEVVLDPRVRHPPCWEASECLFSRKPSRAAGEFLYHSGTLSLWRERCTRSSCSLGTRSPTFCNSFSGGCNKNKNISMDITYAFLASVSYKHRIIQFTLLHTLSCIILSDRCLLCNCRAGIHLTIQFQYKWCQWNGI